MPLVDPQVLSRKLMAPDTTPEQREAILSFTDRARRAEDVMDEGQIAPVLAHLDSQNYDKASDQEPFLIWGLKQMGSFDAAKPLDDQISAFARSYQIPTVADSSAVPGGMLGQEQGFVPTGAVRDDAEKRMRAFFKETQQVSPWFEKTPEDQKAEVVSTEKERRAAKLRTVDSPSSQARMVSSPGKAEDLKPFDENDPKAVGALMDARNNDEFWKSPKLVRKHFSADLSKKTESMAYLIGASNDPEKMVNAMQEQLGGLPADELAKVLLLARATNPTIDAGMLRRLSDSAFSPALAIGSQVIDWMKDQGMSLAQYRDGVKELHDRLSTEFGADYLKIRGKDGSVLPEYAERFDRLVDNSQRLGKYRYGNQAQDAAMMQDGGALTDAEKSRKSEFLSTIWEQAEDGKRWRDKDRVAYFANQSFGREKFQQKGSGVEFMLGTVEGISYMTTLLAASAVPVVGPGLSFGLVYASQQSQDSKKLMYEYGVNAQDAEALSSISAAFIAAIEYQQVVQVQKMVAPKMYIGPQTRGVYMHAVGEYFKRVSVAAVPETAEEILQNGVSYGLMVAAKYGAKAQGIDLSDEAADMWAADMQAVVQMPFILAGSGLMIRGAVAGKAGAKGGFKAGLRELTPVEIVQALDDSIKTPHVFMADQKDRRALAAVRGREPAVDLIPQSDLEVYRSFQNNRGDRAGSSTITPKQNPDGTWVAVPDLVVEVANPEVVDEYKKKIQAGDAVDPVLVDVDNPSHIVDGNHRAKAYQELGMDVPVVKVNRVQALTELAKPGATPASVAKMFPSGDQAEQSSPAPSGPVQTPDGAFDSLEAWMESKGYDPVNDRALFEVKDAHQEAVRARVDEANLGFSEVLTGVEEDESGTVPVDVRLDAAIQHAESIGLKVVPVDTEDEAIAEFPAFGAARAAGKKGQAAVIGDTLVIVRENLKTPQDMLRAVKEEIGHRRIALNPNKGNLLDQIRDIMGDETLRRLLPEYDAIYGKNHDAFADEFLARQVLAKLDTAKGRAALEERGFMNKLRAFVKDVYGFQNPGEMAAKQVVRLALDVLDYNAAEAAKATAGVAPMDLKVGGRKYQRSAAGEWSTKGSVIRDAETVAMLNDEASKQTAKDEARRVKAGKARAEKKVQAMADADPSIKVVLENGGIKMPEGKESEWPEEMRAVPKRFRGKDGGGLAMDDAAAHVAAIRGQTADYGDNELLADLVAFESKAERVMQDAGDPELSAQAEEELIRDLESGKITQAEFDAAMAEMLGMRFSIAPDDWFKYKDAVGEWATPDDEQEVRDAIKEKNPFAGQMALEWWGSGGFVDINMDSGSKNPETKALVDYVSKLPKFSGAPLWRMVAFQTAKERMAFMKKAQVGGDPVVLERTLSAFTTENPSTGFSSDIAGQFGDFPVVLNVENSTSGRDISFIYASDPSRVRPGTEIVLMRETAIKFDRKGALDGMPVLYGSEVGSAANDATRFSIQPDALGFYSPLEKAIDGFKQETFTVEQLRGMVKNAPGVKQEELDDIGFNDWLDGLQGKVTKAQALEFVRNGGPQVQEVVKGVGAKYSADEDGMAAFIEDAAKDPELWDVMQRKYNMTLRGDYVAADSVKDFWDFGGYLERQDYLGMEQIGAVDYYVRRFQDDSGVGGTKFSQYQMPGGENYREVLLTLPGIDYKSGHWDDRGVIAHVRLNDRTTIGDSPSSGVKSEAEKSGADSLSAYSELLSNSVKTEAFQTKGLSGLDVETRKAVLSGMVGAVRNPEIFRGVVELIPIDMMDNLLAAKLAPKDLFSDVTMLSDLLSGDNNLPVQFSPGSVRGFISATASFIAERVSGSPELSGFSVQFSSTPSTGSFHKENRMLFIEEIQSDIHQAGRKQGYGTQSKFIVFDRGAIVGEYATQAEAQIAAVKAGDSAVIEDRSKRGIPGAPFKKSWSMLAFKRVLRMAAEQGYDSVGWTDGATQADRYDLSKQVDSIETEKTGDDSWTVRVYKDGTLSPVIMQDRQNAADLEGLIGKDLAKKIVESGDGHHEFKGIDLKVGGEGMKGFYDQILPKEVGKYVGKMGGKVSTIKINSEAQTARDAANMADFNPDDFALDEDGEAVTDLRSDTGVEVWSLSITDAMRESVMQGQPRFSLAGSRMYAPSKNIATFNGVPFWSGSVSLLDGKIEETHGYNEAEANDFHHSQYFSKPAQERMTAGESGFFWVENGKVMHDWHGKLPAGIVGDIEKQIKFDGAEVSRRHRASRGDPYADPNARYSVSSENPVPLVTTYLAWDILHDTESKDLLKRARYHYKDLGVDVPDKKALLAMIAEAQEIATQTSYRQDTNGLSEQEMAKYVRTEAARRWILSKMADVRRSGEKGGAIYEAARRDTIAKFERQSDSLIRKLRGYSASDLKDGDASLQVLMDKMNLPPVDAPKPREGVAVASQEGTQGATEPDAEADAGGDSNAEIPAIPSDFEQFGVDIRDWMGRVQRAVVRKLQAEGVIRADAPMNKALYSSLAEAAYRKTMENILLETSGKVNFSFGREWITKAVHQMRDYKTIQGFENQAERLLVAINKYRVQESHEQLTTEVWEIIKTGAKEFRKSRLAEVNRRLPGRVERLFKNIVEVMDMNPDAVVERFDALLAELNTSAEGISDQDAEDAKKSMLFALQRFGGFFYKELSDKKTSVEWLNKKMEDSLIRQEELREEMKAQTDEERKLISDTLRRGKLKGWGKRKFSDINTAGLFLQHRLQLLVGAGQGADFDAGSKWADDFAFEIQGAAARKTATVHRANADFVEAVRVLYGTDKPQDIIRDLMKKRDEFSKFSAVGMPMEKDAVLQQLATLAQERYRNAALVMIEIEQRLTGLYGADFRMALKDATRQEVAEKLYTNPDEFYKYQSAALGVNLSDGQVLAALESIANGARMARRLEQEPAMLKAMDAADLALMDWMRDYYRKNRDELSKATADITGLEFEDNGENFLPVKIKFDNAPIVSVRGVVLPVVPASLSARQIHFRDLDEKAGLLTLFVDRTKSNSQFLGFGKMHQRVNRIFGDQKLREDIALAHGEGFYNGLKDHLTDTIAGDAISHKDNIIDQVVNFFAVSALAYNASLLPKQMTAIPAYAMYGSVANMFKYSAEGMAALPLWLADRAAGKHTSDNETVQMMHNIFDSDYAIARLQGGRTDIQRDVLSKLPGEGVKYWQAYAEKGMIFTKYGDMFSILTFGSGYYRAMLAEASAKGMTVADGKKWAMNKLWMLVEATQSSGQIANKAEWQRRMGSGGRLLGQFTGPQQGFVAKVVTDFRMLRFAMEGGDKARISAAWKQLAKSGAITVEMNMAYVIMGILWNWLLGRVPDERDADRVLVAMLTGPFAGAFFTGAFVQAAVQGITGSGGGFGSDMTPASSLTGVVRYGTTAVGDLVTGDVDGFLKNLDRLGSRLQPVYRDVRKVQKNYFK